MNTGCGREKRTKAHADKIVPYALIMSVHRKENAMLDKATNLILS
jgi:hypothetical protein